MQAERPAAPAKPVPACAQPIEWSGDDNIAVTMPTTTQRTRNNEHATAARAHASRSDVRAFPQSLRACHDYIVTPARVFSVVALLFLPLAATACPRTEALTETEAKAEATMQPTADTTATIASPAESEAEEEEDATPEVLARVAARTAAAAAAVRAHRRRLRAHELAAVAADKALSRRGRPGRR